MHQLIIRPGGGGAGRARLGASALTLGLIEGAAEATALIAKAFSGAPTDFFGLRKPLAVLGYGLGALSKPLIAIAPMAGFARAARWICRVGNGLRGEPRDELVASTLAGLLWDRIGGGATFAAGAVFSVLALATLLLRRTPLQAATDSR